MDDKELKRIGKPILGIIGGLGPFASAEFLRTIYECNVTAEPEMPRVIMISDPSIPDRKQSFLDKNDGDLLRSLIDAINQLHILDADKIVICCVSLHYLLPKLNAELQRNVISLIDVIIENLIVSGQRHLLLSSTVPLEAKIFEKHRQWQAVKNLMVFPTEGDQQLILQGINQYKIDTTNHPLIPVLKKLLSKYETSSFIAGCSELHLLTKQLLKEGNKPEMFIDPLYLIASRLFSLMQKI